MDDDGHIMKLSQAKRETFDYWTVDDGLVNQWEFFVKPKTKIRKKKKREDDEVQSFMRLRIKFNRNDKWKWLY